MTQPSNQTERDKSAAQPKRGRGRPGTGSLRLCAHGWAARIVTIEDGEKVRKMVRLGTTSNAVAKRKLARLLSDSTATLEGLKLQASRAETYAELAERVAASRNLEGIADAHSESTRERLWILLEIGHLSLASVLPEHIAGIYETVRAAGRSQSSLRHVRAILRSRFQVAMNSGLASNPLDRVRIPKVKIDRRERAVLSDDELVRYLGWQHPQERFRLAVLERQTMSALARMFGGVRTGDLHSMMWEHFDTTNDGAFTWGVALRKKTARPQRIEKSPPCCARSSKIGGNARASQPRGCYSPPYVASAQARGPRQGFPMPKRYAVTCPGALASRIGAPRRRSGNGPKTAN